MFCWVILTILTETTASAVLTKQAAQEDAVFTPLKLQYVAPKAFLTSAGMIAAPQLIQKTKQGIINPQQRTSADGNMDVPLTFLTVQPENYLNQERTNRLPLPNNLLPELQFADQRYLPLISNSQASALLNAAYQPGYVLMAMPPSSYAAVTYYDDDDGGQNNQKGTNQQQSNSAQETNDHNVNSKLKVLQRSNSDTVSASDSSLDYADSTKTKAFSLSYKDNHVHYSY